MTLPQWKKRSLQRRITWWTWEEGSHWVRSWLSVRYLSSGPRYWSKTSRWATRSLWFYETQNNQIILSKCSSCLLEWIGALQRSSEWIPVKNHSIWPPSLWTWRTIRLSAEVSGLRMSTFRLLGHIPRRMVIGRKDGTKFEWGKIDNYPFAWRGWSEMMDDPTMAG